MAYPEARHSTATFGSMRSGYDIFLFQWLFKHICPTVDGRNPAPLDSMIKLVNVPWFTRFCMSQLVKDVFHQQYGTRSSQGILNSPKSPRPSTPTCSTYTNLQPNSSRSKYWLPKGYFFLWFPSSQKVSKRSAFGREIKKTFQAYSSNSIRE